MCSLDPAASNHNTCATVEGLNMIKYPKLHQVSGDVPILPNVLETTGDGVPVSHAGEIVDDGPDPVLGAEASIRCHRDKLGVVKSSPG